MKPASPAHSLRRRLQWFVLAAIVLSAVVQGISAYRGALQQADAMFDYHLQQMANSMRGGLPLVPFAERQDDDDADDFVVQIWGANGAQLYRSAHARLPPRAVLGFSDVAVQGTRYRVYTLQSALQTIQIAQDLSARQSRASTLAARAVLPVVLLAPLLMLAVWWVISSSLAPLERARRQVAQRDADDLSALGEGGLPREIQPLVHELNGLLARVRSSVDQQRQFVADAAHELRSPLTALRLQAQALRPAAEPGTTAPDPAAVQRLNEGIERAIRLVEQMLALAGQDAPSAPLARQAVVLAGLIREAIGELLPLARSRHIDLGLLPGPQGQVQGQPEDLLVLLRNLLDNAIKYSPDGARVDVSLHDTPEGVLLRVDDSGPGIAPTERERVFERFVRGGDARVSGSGLGLAIVRSIAQRHGARIRLDSAAELGGLRVDVLFPR